VSKHGCTAIGTDGASREMGESDTVLAEVMRPLLEASHPEKVAPFGSRARREARPDGDIDLRVIRGHRGTATEEQSRTYAALAGMGLAMAAVVVRPSCLQRHGGPVGTAIQPARRKGRTLHAWS